MSELSAFWHVVGGGDKGGIVVRSGEDVRSELCSERLGTGAVVKELELRGDGSSGSASQRMRFEKISGFGPSSGWVSLKLTNGKDLLRKQKGPLWRVVGGEKSGILVREGMNMNSSECGRLSTGSVVEEVELVNERLRYKLLHGTGPEFGWVSLSVHTKPLLLRLGHDLDQDPLRSLDAVERFVLALRNLNDLAIQESHDLLRGFTLEERVEAIRKITSLFEEADFRLKRKTLRCLFRRSREELSRWSSEVCRMPTSRSVPRQRWRQGACATRTAMATLCWSCFRSAAMAMPPGASVAVRRLPCVQGPRPPPWPRRPMSTFRTQWKMLPGRCRLKQFPLRLWHCTEHAPIRPS